MKQEMQEVRLMKASYQAPKGELIRLEQPLSILAHSFSMEGEMDQFEEGEELGIDSNGNPINWNL